MDQDLRVVDWMNWKVGVWEANKFFGRSETPVMAAVVWRNCRRLVMMVPCECPEIRNVVSGRLVRNEVWVLDANWTRTLIPPRCFSYEFRFKSNRSHGNSSLPKCPPAAVAA